MARNNELRLEHQKYRTLAKITKSFGRPLSIDTYAHMKCWGSYCVSASDMYADVSVPNSALSERGCITIASTIDTDEFRAAGAVRPELDWSVLSDSEMYDFIAFHEIGHHVDNFDIMHTWTMQDAEVQAQCARHIMYVNEVMADRYAWNCIRPGRPLTVNARGKLEKERFAFAYAYLDLHCRRRSMYTIRPLSPLRYQNISGDMIATQERAAFLGPGVNAGLLSQSIRRHRERETDASLPLF